MLLSIAILIECDVQPFDVVEAESEVVAGAMSDYGGILFMLVYLSAGVI
jgi:NADH:ubiquinone oxidoreductase subunit H